MKYRIWAGLARNQDEFVAMKPRWMPRARDSLHDALWDAMQINDDGRQTVWEIEGDDGSCLNRQAISDEVRKRRQELIANPPKTY